LKAVCRAASGKPCPTAAKAIARRQRRSGAALKTRPAGAADRPAVLRLFARHLAELGYASDPALDADMLDFPGQYARAPNAFLVAAAPNGQLVGMAGLLDGEIRRVHVRARWRKRGVARALVGQLARRAREAGLSELRALLAESNSPSRRVFLACGFTATGRRPASASARHCEVFARKLQGTD